MARRLLAAIAERDYDGVAACFAPDASFKALTPHRLREEEGADAIAARYRHWLDPLEPFELLAADCERIADRVRLRYRFRGLDARKGWQENEHTAYAAVEDGRIVSLTLTCAGFRALPESR